MNRSIRSTARVSLVASVIAGSICAALAGPARADIVPISINRSISVFGLVAPIVGESEFDSDNTSFSQAGTFDDQLSALVELADAEAQSNAFQTSFVNEDGSLFASGGFQAASTLGSTAEFAEALGLTQLRLRFSVDIDTPARVFGALVASGNGVVNLSLIGPNGVVLYESLRNVVESVDEDLVLTVGSYELVLSTSGYGQALPNGEFPSGGNFEISFEPEAPASAGSPTLVLGPPTVSPNPVTRDAEIRFRGPAPEGRDLTVVAADGRLVRTLGPVGDSVVRWDTRTDGGSLVPAGVYFIRLAGTSLSARTVVLR